MRLGRGEWLGVDGGGTAIRIGADQAVLVQFVDSQRQGAQTLIDSLKARGLPVSLLSGDTETAVGALAANLGITDWTAGMFPQDKIDILQAKARAGRKVLMVGDGLNDLGALSVAHVSIAPASAIEATRVGADMVLVSPDLSKIDAAIGLARSARRRILENFAVAAIYNAIAVPLAFIGLATPLAAAIAMSSSSIVVSLNALRTR